MQGTRKKISTLSLVMFGSRLSQVMPSLLFGDRMQHKIGLVTPSSLMEQMKKLAREVLKLIKVIAIQIFRDQSSNLTIKIVCISKINSNQKIRTKINFSRAHPSKTFRETTHPPNK
jgi:hypothetical protein